MNTNCNIFFPLFFLWKRLKIYFQVFEFQFRYCASTCGETQSLTGLTCLVTIAKLWPALVYLCPKQGTCSGDFSQFQLNSFSTIYHWNNIESTSYPPRLISTQKSPRTPALQRKWEVWDLSADSSKPVTACLHSGTFLLLPITVDRARTSNLSPLPLLLLIRGALDKLFMKKKKLFSFFHSWRGVWSHSLPVRVF